MAPLNAGTTSVPTATPGLQALLAYMKSAAQKRDEQS